MKITTRKRSNNPFRFLFFLSMVLLSSCGYRSTVLTKNERTNVSIPYINGDETGLFTRIFIQTLSESGKFNYISSSEKKLEISITSNFTDQIGYRYDREKATGIRINRLEPVEGRRMITADVRVIHSKTGEVLFGPFQIESYGDYDFVEQDSTVDVTFINSAGKRESTLEFSLGQVDSEEGAKMAVLRPLYHCLSKKILDVLVMGFL